MGERAGPRSAQAVAVDDPAAHRREEEERLVAAARRGEDRPFTELVERYRRPLHMHCYRMVGSVTEAEDLVQETLLRVWRRLETFEGRSTFRTWIYRIATNACLDVLDGRPRRVLPYDVVPATAPGEAPQAVDYLSIEPYPDQMLGAQPDSDPDAVAVARETIELALLAAIQHLPVRQRAVVILRDILGWSAKDAGAVLDISEAAVKSALQRGRTTLKVRLPPGRDDWSKPATPTELERSLLERYIAAHEHDDPAALAAVLRDDVRVSYPPQPLWRDSSDAFITSSAQDAPPGDYRFLTTRANGQPALAIYLREPGATVFRPVAIEVLRIEGDKIAEIIDFDIPRLVPAFGLPAQL